MQESMPIGTGGMAAIIGSSLSQISKLLPELNKIGKIYVANDNADGQIVLSGEIRVIDHICSMFVLCALNIRIIGLNHQQHCPIP